MTDELELRTSEVNHLKSQVDKQSVNLALLDRKVKEAETGKAALINSSELVEKEVDSLRSKLAIAEATVLALREAAVREKDDKAKLMSMLSTQSRQVEAAVSGRFQTRLDELERSKESLVKELADLKVKSETESREFEVKLRRSEIVIANFRKESSFHRPAALQTSSSFN
jgi:hypothetical protein